MCKRIIFFSKKHLIIAVLFMTSLVVGQTDSSVNPDYYAIDKYNRESHIKSDQNDLNILFSSNDCDKCILYVSSLLKELKGYEKNNQITVNVITDNIAYAKKNLSKYNLKFNYFYDKVLFSKFGVGNRTLLYLKNNEAIITDVDAISKYLNKNHNEEVVFQFNDSIVNPDKIISSIAPYNTFLTLDPKMDIAILFIKSKSSDKSFNVRYITGKVTDSLKMFNLPERVVNKDQLKKTNFKNFSLLAKQNDIPFVKVHTFSSLGQYIYCKFSLTRLYEQLQQPGKYMMLNHSFIAVKKIKNEKELEDIMNIDTYEQFYLVDTFEYNGEIYPMSTWIYDSMEIVKPNTITTKVNKVVPGKNDLEFGGRATINLDSSKQVANMVSVDKNEENKRVLNNVVNLNNFNYKIDKQIIDESRNYGPIRITKTSVSN